MRGSGVASCGGCGNGFCKVVRGVGPSVVDVPVAVVVAVVGGVDVVVRRRGVLTIILSICRCVRRSLLLSSVVSVHEALP